jgi:hypothetical protein
MLPLIGANSDIPLVIDVGPGILKDPYLVGLTTGTNLSSLLQILPKFALYPQMMLKPVMNPP